MTVRRLMIVSVAGVLLCGGAFAAAGCGSDTEPSITTATGAATPTTSAAASTATVSATTTSASATSVAEPTSEEMERLAAEGWGTGGVVVRHKSIGLWTAAWFDHPRMRFYSVFKWDSTGWTYFAGASAMLAQQPLRDLTSGGVPDEIIEWIVSSETGQLYPVVVDGRLGFIDKSGEMVIEPQFGDWPNSVFSERLAPVCAATGDRFGYIDATGAWVIRPRFDIADPFAEGMAAVVGDNGLWGFIDKTGALAVPARYGLHPGPFSDGLCCVCIDERHKGGILRSEYIDKTGAVVLGPFEWSTSFSEGLGAVGEEWNGVVKWGFMDTSGAMVIEPQFDFIRGFSEGLAAVGFPQEDDSTLWGFIDKTGVLVIEPRFAGVDPFSEGLAPVVVWEGDVPKWGYIDTSGAMVIEPRFEWAAEFSEGLAAVGTNSGLFGFIDRTGAFVIPMEREACAIYPFSGGLARFDVETADGSISPAYLDKAGLLVWQAPGA